MKGWTESWHIRASFSDFYIFMWHSLDVVDIDRAVLPRDAALEVDEWGHDPRTHRTLYDIYRTLHGPGLLRDDPRVTAPLHSVLERIRRGFITEELILVQVNIPTITTVTPPSVPPSVPPPAPPPQPPPKTWIKIKVIHADGTPVVGRDYELTLPDGSPRTGTLRKRWDPDRRKEDNLIHVTGLNPGTCSIKFPHTADPVKPGKRPQKPTDKDGWIKIQLVEKKDGEKVVITDGTYRLTLPNGDVETGSPDSEGRVESFGFKPGVCKFSFKRGSSPRPPATPPAKPPATPPAKPPATPPAKPPEKKSGWIKVKPVDENGKPITAGLYKLVLPNGEIGKEGQLEDYLKDATLKESYLKDGITVEAKDFKPGTCTFYLDTDKKKPKA